MLKRLAANLIEIYQRHLRRMLPVGCRFYPTCSEYTREAIIKYGPWQGGVKGLKRILRCHPLARKSGYDPLI